MSLGRSSGGQGMASVSLRDTMMAVRMGSKNPIGLIIAIAAFIAIWWFLSNG